MAILINDQHLEQQIDQERRRRGHKAQAKTLRELAQERLAELHTGQFLPPAHIQDPDRRTGDVAATSAA